MDPAALTDLLQRHSALIQKVAAAYCPDRAGREDVVQEILVQLWQSYRRYDGRCKESTWVYRVALNTAISRHRRERRHVEGRVEVLELDGLPDDPAGSEFGDDSAAANLSRAVATLRPLDKALVLLHLDGHDNASIADVLGLSPSNVGTKLHRIKASLREVLARLGSTEDHATR